MFYLKLFWNAWFYIWYLQLYRIKRSWTHQLLKKVLWLGKWSYHQKNTGEGRSHRVQPGKNTIFHHAWFLTEKKAKFWKIEISSLGRCGPKHLFDLSSPQVGVPPLIRHVEWFYKYLPVGFTPLNVKNKISQMRGFSPIIRTSCCLFLSDCQL